MLNAATLDFIRDHVNDDVRQLALGRVPDDVNLREALTQIEGRQLSVRKLPACAATDGFRFPPRLSLEQCSSEATAAYKRTIVARLISTLPPEEAKEEGLSFIDLTGGLGIDFMAIAPLFRRAVYVERNPELCDLARHNLPLMGCPHAEVLCQEVTSGDSSCFPQHFSCCFIDPARRDAAGRKMSIPFPGNRHFYFRCFQATVQDGLVSIPFPGNRHFYQAEACCQPLRRKKVSIPFPGNRHFYPTLAECPARAVFRGRNLP